MRVIETKVVRALKCLDKTATSVKTTGSVTVSDSIRAECRQNRGLLWERCHDCHLMAFSCDACCEFDCKAGPQVLFDSLSLVLDVVHCSFRQVNRFTPNMMAFWKLDVQTFKRVRIELYCH